MGPEGNSRQRATYPCAIISVLGARPRDGSGRVGGRGERDGKEGKRAPWATRAIRGKRSPGVAGGGGETRGRGENQGVMLKTPQDIHKGLKEKDRLNTTLRYPTGDRKGIREAPRGA